ncbi:YfiR family protein [Sulfurimonas sp. SAG-AH-194-I05]|nr:YfiR family protein [Sulfurimonas sp. SAG-AH-194-I05]MDF1875503.1 YfiR family protein [Sulfurimonas sp. SAG-AH-194-I05]
MIVILLHASLFAASSEKELEAVVIGKFSHFITWQEKEDNKNFIITIFNNNTFDTSLETLYHNKKIHKKPVKINYIDSIDDIGFTHILFVTTHSIQDQKSIIDYAQKNAILTISKNSGFAQRGGVIQLSFVSQKIHLKINNNAAKKSNLKISALLLSIANVIQGDK